MIGCVQHKPAPFGEHVTICANCHGMLTPEQVRDLHDGRPVPEGLPTVYRADFYYAFKAGALAGETLTADYRARLRWVEFGWMWWHIGREMWQADPVRSQETPPRWIDWHMGRAG